MLKGTAGDSFFLMFVRVITLVLGLVMTRMLSGHFSLQEYGTYSQIMLLTTTISSVTILGMMDGINFFFCKEKVVERRNAYVSTIFFLQYVASAITSLVVIVCAVPISNYFGNESLKSLMLFAAILPVLQNSISLLQIMFIAIGKAKAIAIRNLVVSVLKLIAIIFACNVFDSVIVVLFFQVATDIAQVLYFMIVLRKKDCKIQVFKFDKSLIKEILAYCVPMAMFAVIKSLNRDSDKFVISFFTDTETLAVYTNASKLLPFDIVMTSFCTVLLPYLTRYIANKNFVRAQVVYKSFLETSYITTIILAVGAICVAPEMMRFLYTEKYATQTFSVAVFIIYTLVDVFSVLNITLILSSAGKTKTIMFSSLGTFVLNIVLNIGLFGLLREIGPAIATLVVTLLQGIIILSFSAKEIKTSIFKLFDWKYLLRCIVIITVLGFGAIMLRSLLLDNNVHYIIVLIFVYGTFALLASALNFSRIKKNLSIINKTKVEQSETQ